MSPQIEATDLLRIDIDSLDLPELNQVAKALRKTILALASGMVSTSWSAPARYNAMHLVKRLAHRLDEVLARIDDWRCEQSAQSETATDLRAVALKPPGA